MTNLNGGTGFSGASIASLGLYIGTLLAGSGDVAIATCFLALSGIYTLIVISTLCRYIINYRRNRHVFTYSYNASRI